MTTDYGGRCLILKPAIRRVTSWKVRLSVKLWRQDREDDGLRLCYEVIVVHSKENVGCSGAPGRSGLALK